MKLTVTIAGSLVEHAGPRNGPVQTITSRIRHQLISDLEHELQSVLQSERAARSDGDADADTRRDALERAVRRIWGAPL
jgi:hypothetical protein